MLTISTFNIQNNFNNYNIEKTKEIIEYLKANKIDILNLQEVFTTCEKDLQNELNKFKFSIYGTYRYRLKLLTKVNEKTPIITNKKVLETETFYLPHFPAFLKRVITKVVVTDEKLNKITIFNTHLDFQYDKVKRKQLQKIINIIKKENNPIILTGDFNLKDNNQIFKDFVNNLAKLGIIHLNIKGKTLKQSKYNRAIDHIFYSKEFKLVDAKIITTLSTSDHYPVLARFKY